MSTGTVTTGVSLTPQEALARDLIVQRVAARHHTSRPRGRSRRHLRAALLLRRLAERLDPPTERSAEPSVAQPRIASVHALPAPRTGGPRPWSAAPRRAPHRHS